MGKFVSVAIDGPAGAGKSTMAKRVAKELGYLYVDTGAIYRTVGYHMWLMGIGPKDADGIRRCLDDVNIEIRHEEDGVQHMILNGQDVTGEIRTPEMSRYASGVSAQKCVRDYLLDMQRKFARKHNVVMDGRDIGTVVLPNAQVKIFLTASPEERAKRRFEELTAKGETVRFGEITASADDGYFPPMRRFEKREIHKVFLRFPNLVLTKKLPPSTAIDSIRASRRKEGANMQTFVRKITSRKFLAALAGVATGLAMVFGVDEAAISTVAGAVTTVASVVSYIMSEGMVDAAAVGAKKEA